jgi:hypothetical protein
MKTGGCLSGASFRHIHEEVAVMVPNVPGEEVIRCKV